MGCGTRPMVLQAQLTRCTGIGTHKSLHLPKTQRTIQGPQSGPTPACISGGNERLTALILDFAPMLTLKQHPIPGYRARTLVNAESADLTVAFASDFGTAGERLTHKAAGKRYIAIPLTTPAEEAGMILAASLRKHGASTLNVAGNGIYTLSQHGWTQESVNLWIYLAVRAACQAVPIQLMRSGGQTGADLAGLVAACELSIPALGYFPKGFLQRGLDQVDRARTPFEIQQQIDGYLVSLRNDLCSTTQPHRKLGTQSTFNF